MQCLAIEFCMFFLNIVSKQAFPNARIFENGAVAIQIATVDHTDIAFFKVSFNEITFSCLCMFNSIK